MTPRDRSSRTARTSSSRGCTKRAGLPVGVYCQGSGGNALAVALEAARAGADLIATAVYPVALTLHRVSGESLAEALAGLGFDPGVDAQKLWEALDLIDDHIGDEPGTARASDRGARGRARPACGPRRRARRQPPRAVRGRPARRGASTEVAQIRGEVGSPPLAAPIGQILGSQALLNVLSASRYSIVVDEMRALFERHWGTPPGAIDEQDIRRAVARTADPDSASWSSPHSELRAQAEGLASSEEELLLLGPFGEEAERLLRAIRGRATGVENLDSVFSSARVREWIRESCGSCRRRASAR